jgi:glycosyltransferase involved in cell wall biosynthesis
MAAGLPVICSAIRGNRDLVKDRDGGILVAIGDKNLLKSAIEEMVEQPDFRSQAGAINAENALQYGCDEILIAMRKIYGEIINARSAGNRNQ